MQLTRSRARLFVQQHPIGIVVISEREQCEKDSRRAVLF